MLEKNGATIIVVTHNAKLIKLAEYLLIIKQGSRYNNTKALVYEQLKYLVNKK